MTLLQQLVSGVAICGGTEPVIDGPGDASLGCRQVFLEQQADVNYTAAPGGLTPLAVACLFLGPAWGGGSLRLNS